MVSYQKRGKVWQYEISYKDLDGKFKNFASQGSRVSQTLSLQPVRSNRFILI